MSEKPFLLLQISDTHLGANWDGAEPDECLLRAVEGVLELPQRPDALVISGDLTQNGTPEEYERVRQLVAPLDLTPHVLPGNHDLRGPLREAFGLPGEGDEHVSYAVDLGPLRLVCLDSIIPGAEAGSLDEGRIEWLRGGRASSGHVHRPSAAELAGRAVVSIPSTYLQSVLKFTAAPIEMRPDPPGF